MLIYKQCYEQFFKRIVSFVDVFILQHLIRPNIHVLGFFYDLSRMFFKIFTHVEKLPNYHMYLLQKTLFK